MKFDSVKNLHAEAFRRLTGIKRVTFDTMKEIIEKAFKNKKSSRR